MENFKTILKNRYLVLIAIVILSYLFVHYSRILVPKQQMKEINQKLHEFSRLPLTTLVLFNHYRHRTNIDSCIGIENVYW